MEIIVYILVSIWTALATFAITLTVISLIKLSRCNHNYKEVDSTLKQKIFICIECGKIKKVRRKQ